MKQLTCSGILLCVAALAAFTPSAGAAGAAAQTAVGATVRFNKQHTMFEDLPLTDGDISFGLTAEYHEAQALWQVGVLYTDAPGTNDVQYMITPHINLIFKDRFWLGGMGVLTSYIARDEKVDSEWLDPYWQMLLGIHFPIGAVHFRAMAYYVFEAWDEIGEFEFDEIEFDASLAFYF